MALSTIRKFLRRCFLWLIADPDSQPAKKPLSYTIQVRTIRQGHFAVIPYTVNSVVGLGLLGVALDNGEERLIIADQAVDKDHWRRLFYALGGGTRKLYWPDGTPFTP